MSNLHKVWNRVKISATFQTTSGGTPKSTNAEYYVGGDIPWINSGDLSESYITSPRRFITKKGMENSSAKIVPAGSVLVAMYGATAGKTSLLQIPATLNQAICAILPNENHSMHFLKYKLDSLYQFLVGLSTGSARDNLSQQGIGELELSVPDKDTQLRIASTHELNLNFFSPSAIFLSSSFP